MPLIVWATSGAAALCMAVLIVATLADPRISVGVLFIAGAFLARSHFRSRFFESAMPQSLGWISYSLYLSHWLVLELAARAFGPLGAVAALPAAFAVGWLVWWSVERASIGASRRIGRSAASASHAFRQRFGATALPASPGERREMPGIHF